MAATAGVAASTQRLAAQMKAGSAHLGQRVAVCQLPACAHAVKRSLEHLVALIRLPSIQADPQLGQGLQAAMVSSQGGG